MMKKIVCVVLMGVLGLSGSLWAIGDEQEDRDARLFKAVQTADFEGAQEAIEAGADVNMRDAEGYTPLLRAVKMGFGAQRMIQLLLDQGARMHFSIDAARKKLLQQGFQKNASEPMSDSDVRKVLVRSAIQGNNTYTLHVVFENIARNPNKEEAYAEAVAFIRMVQDTQFTQNGLIAIKRFASKDNKYLLSLQHLIVRFSDETAVTLFLEALKEVCGKEEAKRILFKYTSHNYKNLQTLSDGINTPFEFLTYGSLIPASKERLLSFFNIIDTVFGEETIQDILMGDFLHDFLYDLVRPGKNNQIARSGDSSNLHLIEDLAQHVPLLLEALADYLGNECLKECFNSTSIKHGHGYRPLSRMMDPHGGYWPLSKNTFNEYFQSFYAPLSAVLNARGARLYCIPILINIEEELGDEQNEFVLAIHFFKQLMAEVRDLQNVKEYMVAEYAPDLLFDADIQLLDLLMKNETVLQIFVENLLRIEDEDALMTFVYNIINLLKEGSGRQLEESTQYSLRVEAAIAAVLFCQIKAIGEAIPLWKRTFKVKSARSAISGTTNNEDKKKSVNARPSDEGSEEEPPRKKQRTLLEEFNREGDDDDDGDEYELYSDDDGWEYTETEYLEPGVERVRMERGDLTGFRDAMRGEYLGFGYNGEHGEERLSGGA